MLNCTPEEQTVANFSLIRYTIEGQENYSFSATTLLPELTIHFSAPIDKTTTANAVNLYGNNTSVPLKYTYKSNDSLLVISTVSKLSPMVKYDFIVDNQLKSTQGVPLFSTLQTSFTTPLDTTDKFPRISDATLMDLLQRQTFKYFWDFGHLVSGLARERNTSGDLVTSGGSGFGVMSIIVGIERGFISRQQGLERLLTMTDFLKNKAERHHGVYPHWLHGSTGKTIPFSTKDDGGDLVETSYLIAGLLCASEYFDQTNANETLLRKNIKDIWEGVEWNWHTKGNENVLYWHWSSKYNWEMNLPVRGWNECLITYVLAAASPTYPISKDVYEKGWARSGGIKNGKSFYGITLPFGPDQGGPLFFSHYSFLGINPSNLKDQYGDYRQQVVNHSKINYAYCVANPRKYAGYSKDCWGLTASDSNGGYDAHSPTNDKGVITPTAALSSMPFTPEESMDALRFFYYKLGDRIYKDYGFVDAFNLTNIWFANSFLAIDQGPIIIMTENHRSGLIWKLGMKNHHIKGGLDKLGFTY
ncbi:MAG: glucoamylase family protein [Saprospiraceae bacterium]